MSNQLMLSERWMIGGTTLDSQAKKLHTWHSILKVDEDKQSLFIQRVLMLHEIASKRGGKSSSNRLSLNDWNLECDRCCLLGYILMSMETEVDEKGDKLFDDALLLSLGRRAVEGTLNCNTETDS